MWKQRKKAIFLISIENKYYEYKNGLKKVVVSCVIKKMNKIPCPMVYEAKKIFVSFQISPVSSLRQCNGVRFLSRQFFSREKYETS